MNPAEMQIIVLAGNASPRKDPHAPSAPDQGTGSFPLLLSRATAIAGHAVSVVLGAQAAEIAPALGRLPVSVVVNRDWSEGIAASIRAGIVSLPGSCSAALLLFAEQTAVSSADLQRLADTWRRSPRSIVAAQYGGRRGLPAIFPRAEFPALLRLRGEQGPEVLLRSPTVELIGVHMPSAAANAGRADEKPSES